MEALCGEAAVLFTCPTDINAALNLDLKEMETHFHNSFAALRDTSWVKVFPLPVSKHMNFCQFTAVWVTLIDGAQNHERL